MHFSDSKTMCNAYYSSREKDLWKMDKGLKICSYAEAVLSCQGFLNRFCCAVCVLEAYKPELLDQTKIRAPLCYFQTQFVFMSNVRNCFCNGEFTLQGLNQI